MNTLFDLPFDDPAPGEDGQADSLRPAAPSPRVLTVSELTARIRVMLEERFAEVWVEGELSNCRVWNTGHLYFTLKDAGAQIRGVMFRSALRLLKFEPRDGQRVVVRGRVSVYDPKGEYQIVCERLEPEGLGARQLAFDQLKRRLAAEGLFDPARKRPLPVLPRRIGIVTSIDGAALRDIIRVLRRRYPNAHLVLAPSRVQGEGAAAELARAIGRIGRVPGVDVVIVGRGGGSLEDLWAFNEELVARAIAACPVPVVSAVGHETDVTIADFVADLRAPTPSAAAELVVRRKDEFVAAIDARVGRLHVAIRHHVRRLEARVRALEARPALGGLPARLAFRGRHLLELITALRQAMGLTVARSLRRHDTLARALARFDPRHRLAAIRARLAACDGRLAAAGRHGVQAARARLRVAAAALDGLSPLAVLGRGYALVWDEARTRILRDAAAVRPGERISVTLARGELKATVDHP